MDFRVVIPVRYASKRLPGKALIDIAGKPMLQHTYERAKASGALSVVIATDDKRIADAARGFGAQVCMTSSDHRSGTERLAEAVSALGYDDQDIVVNLQCDEPMIPSDVIQQLAKDLLFHDHARVATICHPISDVNDIFDPNVVKVVLNKRGFAIYFSRAPIPWEREHFSKEQPIMSANLHYRHIGIYAYRCSFLSDYLSWDSCPLTDNEQLEQLKILWNGNRIHVTIAKQAIPIAVDTPEDLAKVQQLMNRQKGKDIDKKQRA